MHEDADPHRVAEVIAGPRRGSGYRVGGTAILTAAHVVSGAAEVVVRCDAGMPGEWSATAIVAWSDVDSDLAMLEFAPPAGAPASVTPVRYGALADRRAVIEVHAAGFPRFKARKGASVYRDLHDFVGTVSVLANRRNGTLEVSVAVPPAADPDGLSPWEGMSGGRAVGAGPHHRRRRGTPPAGGPGPAVGGPRRQHDAGPGALDDVLADPPGWMDRSGYVEQVRDIALAGGLKGREAELDELAGFCGGDESYVYWQAAPWAGKSALMSTFVLNPPDGVDVVSFFITARLATQADSDAFTEALVEQLSRVIGEDPPPVARDHHRRALLKAAAAHCEREGRRLVLIVDGMDEDAGAPPGSGLASIASLLPKQPVRLVERLVAAGEFARARALAHVVSDDEGRAEALLLLARSLAAAGQTEDASRTLDDAAAAGKDQIEIFLEVARAQADLEQHARAALVLKYAADAARVMARARRFRPGYTIRLLVELATALDEVTIRPLVSVATAAVHIGQTDMAKDLLEVAVETASQADVSVRAEALTVAARGLIALGERDRALEMIEQAVGHADPSRYRDASALRQATELLFALVERDRARRAFDGSLDAARRDSRAQEMLSSLARDTLELGEAGLALVAVAAMSDASQRRRVISNLAHCCAAGLRDTLIAGALESMSWVDVLPALAEFDVPALVAIADEVMAVNPSGVDGS